MQVSITGRSNARRRKPDAAVRCDGLVLRYELRVDAEPEAERADEAAAAHATHKVEGGVTEVAGARAPRRLTPGAAR